MTDSDGPEVGDESTVPGAFEPEELEPQPPDLRELERALAVMLPEPVERQAGLDGAVVLVGGAPGEVVIRLTTAALEVSIFDVVWDGPASPVIRGQAVATFPLDGLAEYDLLAAARQVIEAARRMRLATYRKCRRCGETNPPEWMHDATICQTCAEKHLGVVY